MVPAVAIPGLSPSDDDAGDPAALLLDRAALATAARRAGRRPDHAEPLPAAEPDTRLAVSPAAARRLARMLGGDHSELLAEWLRAVTTRGLRPPHQLLPALLDRALLDRALLDRALLDRALLDQAGRTGSAEPGLARLIAEAGGPRARWLAALNFNWQFAQAETPDADWRLGTARQRHAYLTALRAGDPEAARRLIADGWVAAGPDERVMFISALAQGLSQADEPLLEAALDDPADQVRERAAYVLASLPGSGFGQRMAERARPCLRLDRSIGPPRLLVIPPERYDLATRRAGIRPDVRAGRSWLDPWAHLLLEVLARTPLGTWTDEFRMTPAQIVAVPVPASNWAPILFAGWSRAAMAQRDEEWIAALIGHAITGRPLGTAVGIEALRQLARRADPMLGAPGALPELGPGAPPGLVHAIRTLRFRYEMLKELDT